MEKEPYAVVSASSEEEEEEEDCDSSYDEEEEEEEEEAVKNKPEAVIPKPKVVLAVQAKRQNDEAEEPPEAKKRNKQQLIIQRLWSDGDEIKLLEGVTDYYCLRNKKEKGTAVETNDTQSLYNHVKKFLKLDATKSQVVEKIRRLKKKYHNILKRMRGKDPTFSKDHDQKLFDMSKKIWGGCENTICTASASAAAAVAAAKLFPKSQQGVEEFVVRHGMEMIEGEKKAELEERWKKLEVAQLELFLHRNQLINDQAKLLLDSMK